MKKFFEKFLRFLIYFILVVGIPAVGYAMYFQSVGPYPDGTTPFYYASLFYCLITVVFGAAVGYLVTRFMEDNVANGKAGAMAVRKGVKSVLWGNVICFFLCILILYLATSYIAFFLGLAGSIFAWTCLVYHEAYAALARKGKLKKTAKEGH